MRRSFSLVFTLLFMGIALSVMLVTCAPPESRTTYPNTFFRKKSTSSYSVKPTTDYKPVPTVTYKPAVPSVTTHKPTTIVPVYKAFAVLPTTTYQPFTESKAPIAASYAKNTFFKAKSAGVSSGKPTEAPAVIRYTPPSAGNDIQLDPSANGKTGLYANTFFKNKPKAYVESNYNKVTTAATTTSSVVISPVKISEPVNEGDVKPAKKVSYTNTYFKAKPAIVSTQIPALENHAAKLSSNDSSSEESSEESHGLGSTSETSEESSEEEGASEEKGEEEASQEGEEHEEGNESNEEEKEEGNEKTEGKKEDEKQDEKEVKKEESKDKVDAKLVQKETLPPQRPTVSSVQLVHEKKEAKPVFLAFKKMRSKPNSA
ncbi:microtubule-associated protein RP/EB family member 1-like [Daphnia carinata]|uniref:microtubule-associated protein RP/EB family member 1-like n=1 Tax=Daphnia carinata TaxID=120202 RepID=UPI00257FA5F8|nr:microtubule-associated protein RP/EB family member 1-like [Daphnia carinata]